MSRGKSMFGILMTGIVAASLAGPSWLTRAQAGQGLDSPGKVHLLLRMNPSHDMFVGNNNPEDETWIRSHWWRMMVYTPWFDNKTSWYPGALIYKNSFGIQRDALQTLGQHPEWLLHDVSGNILFVQYDCKPSQNTCPLSAADIGNPAYRAWWISQARSQLRKGYRGLWIDDVNMTWRISNGQGKFVNPVDPRTGTLMSEDDWRRYMAEFMEQVRRELPGIDILHNAIWFVGSKGFHSGDVYIRREILAADYVNNEHGVYGDKGLRGGTGEWSFDTLLKYYDQVHALSRGVVIDEVSAESNTPEGREFTLATYFLVSSGHDALGNQQIHNSSEWWAGYDTDLGTPMGPRISWRGLYRRDFSGGIVLVNPPESPTVTVTLDAPFALMDGTTAKVVSIPSKRALVLKRL